MKFVLVNDRIPFRRSFCARCRKPIGANYLREIGTRLCYCDPKCYVDHGKKTVLALEILAFATSLLADPARMYGFGFPEAQPQSSS